MIQTLTVFANRHPLAKRLLLSKRRTLSSSVRQLRSLVWWLTAMVALWALVVCGLIARQQVRRVVEMQAIRFAQQSQATADRLGAMQRLVDHAEAEMAQLADQDAPSAGLSQPGEAVAGRYRDDRALIVSAAGTVLPERTELAALSALLAHGWYLNGGLYQSARNAYVVDLKSPGFHLLPRRRGEAQARLTDSAWHARYVSQVLGRFRPPALLRQLYADPDEPVVLPPMIDPISGKQVVSYVRLVQQRGNPLAILAIDVPTSALLPDGVLLSGFTIEAPGTGPISSTPSGPDFRRVVSARLAAVQTMAGASWIYLGGWRWGLLFQYGIGDWQMRAMVPAAAVWAQACPTLLPLLAAMLAGAVMLIGWLLWLDWRVLRPGCRQTGLVQDSETYNRGVVRIAPVGLMTVRREDGKILKANQTARELICKVDAAEIHRLIGRCQRVAPVRSGDDAPVRFEIEMSCPGGGSRFVQVGFVTSPYLGLPALLLMLSDCSEARMSEARLKQAVAEAAEANRAKSAFLATMSHEIRTPLNGMLGGIELLDMTRLDMQQRDRLEVIKRSSRSLINTINDVLDFSKIEAGQMVIRPQPCNVVDIVEGVARNFTDSALAKRIDLYCTIDPVLRSDVVLDGVRLEQVLGNLVSNAVKFTDNGKVMISVAVPDGESSWLDIKVVDTGIGIAEEDQKRLFAPFIQAEQSDTRRYGGTGLGLSICRRLLSLMGGEIRLVSEPGFGSSFRLTVPYEEVVGTANDNFPMLLRGVTVKLALSSPELQGDLARWLRWHHARVIDSSAPEGDGTILVTDARLLAGYPKAAILLGQGATGPPKAKARYVSWLSRGAIVDAVLQIAGRAPQREERPAAPLHQLARRQRRILLVEDHQVNQIVMRGQLESLGQVVDVVGDGIAALEQIHQADYDLVITDIQMPKMDGYTLARALRAQGIGLPIVAISANAYRDEREQASSAGVDQFLTKPVQISALRTLLDTLLPSAPAAPPAPKAAGRLSADVLVRTLEGDLVVLQEAWANGDATQLRQRAHALAGALAVIGYDVEGEHCRALEKALATTSLADVEPAWQELQAMLEDVLALLQVEAADSAA
ncbi:hybrid sensor histidine kinase/response regulator [Jeongeupia sp. USM3]|uniref:hybrid sensor histidine kinase/response regulator n=1 Tax=Jeongeupia sp. USM3 TaxID=1906741 RepID=UPI0011AB4687|nr:hybrid sensor histidine kinase/response regulator [Jeongeupia sp. USM3]